MTPFEKLMQTMLGGVKIDVWLVAKIGVLLLLLLYVLFSLVVVKQIKLMSKTVNGVMEKQLLVAAKVLVGVAVTVFLIALVIL